MRQLKEVVSLLLKQKDNKRVDNVVVTKATSVKLKSGKTKVKLQLADAIDAYAEDSNTGEFVRGTTNELWIPIGQMIYLFEELEMSDMLVNAMRNGVNTYAVKALCGAKIDVILEEVRANVPHAHAYDEEREEELPEHDTIYHHIVAIRLSDNGKKIVQAYEDAAFAEAVKAALA